MDIQENAKRRFGKILPALPQSPRHLKDRRRLVGNRLELVRETQEASRPLGDFDRHALDHDLAEKFRHFALHVVQDVLAMGDVLLELLIRLARQHLADTRQELKVALLHEVDLEKRLIAGNHR